MQGGKGGCFNMAVAMNSSLALQTLLGIGLHT